MTTSSTMAGSRSLRATRALRTSPARSAGCQPDSLPLRFPPAVRMASTITALAMCPPWSWAPGSSTVLPRPGAKGQPVGCAAVRNMDRWLGDGGMPIIESIGGSFDGYGPADDTHGGWASATWSPTALACNPQGVVQAGVHCILLDAAMNFAVSAGLTGRDRPRATLDLKTELIGPATTGSTYAVRGQVVRMAKQVAFVEADVRDNGGRLVSRATATFLLYREG